MAPVPFDDSVEKLEGFCALLARTSAVLTRDQEALDARAGTLERLDTETDTRLDGVVDRLTAAIADLASAHEDADDELGRLADAAQDVVSSGLEEVDTRLASAQGAFEERLEGARAEVERSFAELGEAGLQPLAAAAENVESGLAQAAGTAAQVMEALAEWVAEVSEQATQEGDATVGALEEAAQAVTRGDGDLEEQGAEHDHVWSEELPEAVAAEAASVAEPLEALYREWEAELVAEGDELSETVAGLLEDAADLVADAAGAPLASAVEETMRALAGLASDQDGLRPPLEEGEAASEAAAALTDDLLVCRRLVGEIERLLNALAG